VISQGNAVEQDDVALSMRNTTGGSSLLAEPSETSLQSPAACRAYSYQLVR